MARGVNKVILLGNLGRDPDVRYMPSGGAVTNIAIATSESWKDKQSGEQQERTEWHNIVFFNRLAEIAGEYLKKGSQVYIEGSLRTRKYTDKNGVERYATEIIANELQMLGSRSGGGGGDSNYDSYAQSTPSNNQGQNQNQNQNQSRQSNAPAQQDNNAPDFDSFDDDIPF